MYIALCLSILYMYVIYTFYTYTATDPIYSEGEEMMQRFKDHEANTS